MNLPINPTLAMTIAADRHRTLVLEAEGRRIRKADRAARKADRVARKADRAVRPGATAVAPLAHPVARPMLQQVPTGEAVVRQNPTSIEREHASARVA